MTQRVIIGKRGAQYGIFVSQPSVDVTACFDDELLLSVSHKVLQAREKMKGNPGQPPNASAYATDTVAMQDEGFRPAILFAPYMAGQDRIVEPHYCIFRGTASSWYGFNYAGLSSSFFAEVNSDQVKFYNGRNSNITWWGAEGDRVAAGILAEQIEDDVPLTGSATRVHMGKRLDGQAGLYVTKPGYNADVEQVSKNVNFSSDLETLDVQATGTYEGLGKDQSITLNFNPALDRLPMCLFAWRPSASNGQVSLGFGYLSLDWRWGYDPTRVLIHDPTGYGGVECNIYKTGLVIQNRFFSAVDIAWCVFDNYWEPPSA